MTTIMRSTSRLFDARSFAEVRSLDLEKHQRGKHNQQTHDGGGGASSFTPQELHRAVYAWKGEAYSRIRPLAKGIIRGKAVPLPQGKEQRARHKENLRHAEVLLSAVRSAPVVNKTLHRGLEFAKYLGQKETLSSLKKTFAKGTKVNLPLDAFSSREDKALSFARGEGYNGKPDGQIAVMLRVKGARALELPEMGGQSRPESEFLTSGNFRVTSIKETDMQWTKKWDSPMKRLDVELVPVDDD